MDSGYRSFFALHPTFCEPRRYVSMWAAEFAKANKIETARYRASWDKKAVRGKSRQRRSRTRSNSVMYRSIDVAKSTNF
jgi:hypothetical protein